MSIALGAGIAAGASALGSLFNWGSQKSANKANRQLAQQQNEYNVALQDRQFAFNREASETEYNRNLEQWNRENEYNTPAAQMQRYIDAGLNPNLIYGSGTSAATAANSPQYTAARYDSPKAERSTDRPANVSIDPYQAVSIGNQLAIQRAQANNIEAQTDYTNAQANHLSLENSILSSRQYGGYFDLQTERLRHDVENLKSQTKFTDARARLLPHQEEVLKQSLSNLRTQNDLDRLRLELSKIGVSDRDNIWQRIAARIFLNYKSDASDFVRNLFK